MKKLFLYFVCHPAFFLFSFAQPPQPRISREEYIEKYKKDAIKEMQLYGVPASITLAQGMLESGNGNSKLAIEANNHFGIKCHNTWTGPTFIQDDDTKNECFRKYASAFESFSDHSDFLKSRSRYAFLFELDITDYKAWAKGLKQAGYATDPKYPERLIKIIEDNKLYEYDALAVQKGISGKEKKNNLSSGLLSSAGRKINLFNNIKYITLKEGDTYFKIAAELDMELWQLYKYNDLEKGSKLVPGQRLYLQPKRKNGNADHHVVKKGETMHFISQMHGIRLKQLYKKNLMKQGMEPKEGDVLFLRKKKTGTDTFSEKINKLSVQRQ